MFYNVGALVVVEKLDVTLNVLVEYATPTPSG